MTREEMLTKVIRAKGFENEQTIWFSKIMENSMISNNLLYKAMIKAIEKNEDE